MRRQCRTCSRQFKWHSGPANEEAEKHPDAEVYYCPLCGSPGESDDWTTSEQDGLIEAAAHQAAMPVLDDMVGAVLDSLKGPNVKVKRTAHLETPVGPDPIIEPDDMVIVASPCHGYEPIKVPEYWVEPVHCLICGERFAV